MVFLSPRHAEIVALAKAEGRVTVDGLAERFGLTPQTIRKDLSELCDGGVLNRYHGGAVPASGASNYGYEARRRIATEEKRAILASQVPVGRLSRSEDIGSLVAFLCSDLGSFICGQSIHVDGGRTLWRGTVKRAS